MREQIEDIRRISLQPGDKLWVKLREDASVSRETADQLCDQVCEKFGLTREQVFLTVGVDEVAAVEELT